jgi:hypothetical protein
MNKIKTNNVEELLYNSAFSPEQILMFEILIDHLQELEEKIEKLNKEIDE